MGSIYNPRSSIKLCAFCKFWNDPTNSVIRAKPGGLWEYEPRVIHECIRKNNFKMPSQGCCSYFDCKIPRG